MLNITASDNLQLPVYFFENPFATNENKIGLFKNFQKISLFINNGKYVELLRIIFQKKWEHNKDDENI